MAGKRLILIVDDEVNSRTLIQKVLQRADYIVDTEDSGEAALTYVKKKLPNLIVLDLMMPGMGGMKCLEELKADPRTKAIPIIVLTGKGQPDFVKKAIALGVDDYVVKPFQPNELLGRIKLHNLTLGSREIREILPLLRIQDRAMASQIAKQVDMPVEFQAFPIVYQDIHLCVVLPMGTSPESLRTVSDVELASMLTLFVMYRGSWKKLQTQTSA